MAKSGLEALRCPNCDGEVELDDKQEYGFCKYCGTKVQNTNFKIIKGEVKVVGNPTVDNYIKLAERYYKEKDYEESLEYYNKALEIEPDNWKAVFKRGICLSRLKETDSFNKKYVLSGVNSTIEIITNNKKLQKDVNIRLEIAYDVCVYAYELYNAEIKKLKKTFFSNETSTINNLQYFIDLSRKSEELIQEIDEIKKDEKERGEEFVLKREATLLIAYKTIINCCYYIFKDKRIEDYQIYRGMYNSYAEKIRLIDSKREIPLETYKVIRITSKLSYVGIRLDNSNNYILQGGSNHNLTNIYDINNRNNPATIVGTGIFWLTNDNHRIIVKGKQLYEINLKEADIIDVKINANNAEVSSYNYNGESTPAQVVTPLRVDSNGNIIQKKEQTNNRTKAVTYNKSKLPIIAFIVSIINVLVMFISFPVAFFTIGLNILGLTLAIISLVKKKGNSKLAIATIIIDGIMIFIFIIMLFLVIVFSAFPSTEITNTVITNDV